MKSCPFCDLAVMLVNTDGRGPMVYCPSCDIAVTFYKQKGNEKELVKIWNNRSE